MDNVVLDMSISLDGYVAAPNDNLEEGLGEDWMRLHNWMFDDPSMFERVYGNPGRGNGRADHRPPNVRQLDPRVG